jgi:hypothetical protein
MDTATTTETADTGASSNAAPADNLFASAQQTQSDAQQTITDPAERPEWMPDKFWRQGKPDYESLAKSYTGLEQLLGKKAQAVVVPNEKSTPEEVAAFRKALGVPDSPDTYVQTLKPEQMPEGVHFDENLAKAASTIAHKHNIPPAAMKELAGLQMAQVQAMVQASQQMQMQEVENGRKELQQVYGEAFKDKINLAARVSQSAGVSTDSPIWRHPDSVRLALWAAEKISEDKIVTADSPIVSSGKDMAKDIMQNPSNPLYARYHERDPEIVDRVRRMIAQK